MNENLDFPSGRLYESRRVGRMHLERSPRKCIKIAEIISVRIRTEVVEVIIVWGVEVSVEQDNC